MGEETGITFRRFLETIKDANLSVRAMKGQIVGPFTLLCGMQGPGGPRSYLRRTLPGYYSQAPRHQSQVADRDHEDLRGAGDHILDEPGLAGFGSSAFITVSSEQVRGLLTEVVQAVHAAGGVAGIHVCANTDWLLAFQSNFDIINFDTYSYFDKFVLYRKECLDFISRGGNIAWGVVPTSDLEV